MKKTYTAACHCGAVRVECDIDLAEGTSRCNCSSCLKSRFWKAIAAPKAFRLVQGGDALTGYEFGGRLITHNFCGRCGVKVFGHVHADSPVGELYAINVACLDASDAELAGAPVAFEDGRGNHWERRPAETRYL